MRGRSLTASGGVVGVLGVATLLIGCGTSRPADQKDAPSDTRAAVVVVTGPEPTAAATSDDGMRADERDRVDDDWDGDDRDDHRDDGHYDGDGHDHDHDDDGRYDGDGHDHDGRYDDEYDEYEADENERDENEYDADENEGDENDYEADENERDENDNGD